MKVKLSIVSLVITLFVSGCMPVSDAPDELDTSTTRTTDVGLYKATILPDLDPVAINKIHSWVLHVETVDGQVVEDASISVDGGMPEHGHGLPTQPKVTEYLGNGDYRVEGMKFQMPGWWEVKFKIDAEEGSDSITFNLILN